MKGKKAYCTPLQEVQTKIPKSVTAYTGPYYVFSEVSKSLFIFMQSIFFVALEKAQVIVLSSCSQSRSCFPLSGGARGGSSCFSRLVI